MTFSLSHFPRLCSALLMLLVYSSSIAMPSVIVFDKFEEFSAGSTVRITLPTVSSATALPGQILTGTCSSGVTIKGVTFVNPGAPVKLRVSVAQAPKNIGKPGTISLEAVSVVAVDGTEVPLSGGVASATGEDSNTKSLLLGLFICILFLLQKGGDATFAPGTTIDAFVANSVDIEV